MAETAARPALPCIRGVKACKSKEKSANTVGAKNHTLAVSAPLTQGRMASDPRPQALAQTVDVGPYLEKQGKRDLMMWLELIIDGEVVSTNFVPFARPKHYELAQPDIQVAVSGGRREPLTIRLESDKPALWVWLELRDLGAVFSDNFFHLVPGRPVEVTVEPWGEITAESLRQQLVVKSLVDTY